MGVKDIDDIGWLREGARGKICFAVFRFSSIIVPLNVLLCTSPEEE